MPCKAQKQFQFGRIINTLFTDVSCGNPSRSAPPWCRRLQLSCSRAPEADAGFALVAALGGGRVMGRNFLKPRLHLSPNEEVFR
jgi:hypothetical protein